LPPSLTRPTHWLLPVAPVKGRPRRQGQQRSGRGLASGGAGNRVP
jgi:hypothetical protein